MDEGLFDYIGYIIFFLFMVLPRILKWLAKRSGGTVEPSPPELPEDPFEGRPIALDDAEEISQRNLEIVEPSVSPSEIDGLFEISGRLLARAEDAQRTCAARGGGAAKFLSFVESGCVRPLEQIKGVLERKLAADGYLSEEEFGRIQNELHRLERLTENLAFMIDLRIRPRWAKFLSSLDIAAQECLVPYLTHARLLDLRYRTNLAVTVLGTPGQNLARYFEGAPLAPVVIDEKHAEQPFTWVQLASDVSLDLFHSTPGLDRRIARDLAVLPAPISLNHYPDEKTFMAGLLGGWLPRIFADVGAGLALGSGFAAGLAAWLTTGQQNRAISAGVGSHETAEQVPLHVRMFIGCRVLQHLNHPQEAANRWQEWIRRMDNPASIILGDTGGRTGALSLNAVLEAVSRVVDYLVQEPLAPLGGYPLPSVPSLACDRQCTEEMYRTAERFLDGEAVDGPGRIILGAAQLAVEKSPTAEMKIGAIALRSLAGEGESAGASIDRAAPASTLNELLRSRDFVARAIVTGATIAPRPQRNRRRDSGLG